MVDRNPNISETTHKAPQVLSLDDEIEKDPTLKMQWIEVIGLSVSFAAFIYFGFYFIF